MMFVKLFVSVRNVVDGSYVITNTNTCANKMYMIYRFNNTDAEKRLELRK